MSVFIFLKCFILSCSPSEEIQLLHIGNVVCYWQPFCYIRLWECQWCSYARSVFMSGRIVVRIVVTTDITSYVLLHTAQVCVTHAHDFWYFVYVKGKT